MTKIFLFFTILFSFSLNAQTKSDSIQELIKNTSNWDEKARLSYEFAKLNVTSNPDQCLANYNLIESNQSKIRDSTHLFNLNNIKGVIFQFRHEIDSSNFYLNRAYNLAVELKDSLLLMKIIGNLAINYTNIGDYQKAVDHTLIALYFHKNNKDTLNWAKTCAQVGNTYIYMENYSEGMAYTQKALLLFKIVDNLGGIANSYGSITYIFEELEELDSALHYGELTYNYQKKVNNIFGLSHSKRFLCKIYKAINKSNEDCLKCDQELLEYDIQIKNKQGIMIDNLNIGITLYNLDRTIESIPSILTAIKLSRELNNNRVKLDCYESLAFSYYNLKEYQNAYDYSDSAKTLEKELLDIDIQKAVLEADKKFQLAEKEKELLKVENEKSQAELKVSEKSKQVGFLIGGILLLLISGGALFYRIKQRQLRRLDKIRIDEQQKGLAAVIQVQEDERKRIAKDLHDGIVQQLVGLKLGLMNLFHGKETEESKNIIKILNNSSEELREISHKMMPRSLGELGLIPALEDMLKNSLGNTKIKHEFEHFGKTKRFKENIEIAVFRISQELINNVIKHSNASHVMVQLFKLENNLILIVEDDGEGITGKSRKDGIGLMNISSRLDTINGKVNFEPSHESGTLATVKIPID